MGRFTKTASCVIFFFFFCTFSYLEWNDQVLTSGMWDWLGGIDLFKYWSFSFIWPSALSIQHCFSHKSPQETLFLKWDPAWMLGWCTPHYLRCDVGVDLQHYILRAPCGIPLQHGENVSSFLHSHTRVCRVTCLLVSDEIVSADAGVVSMRREINKWKDCRGRKRDERGRKKDGRREKQSLVKILLVSADVWICDVWKYCGLLQAWSPLFYHLTAELSSLSAA